MAKIQHSKPSQPEKTVAAVRKKQPEPVVKPAVPSKKVITGDWSFNIRDFKIQAIIISLIALAFYFNTFYNEYAHDDGIVIVKNEYVQEGFAGIPDIMSKDAYDSYYRQLNTINQLQGGRYRPLSIVTFAIEQQFLGAIGKDSVGGVLKQNLAYGVHGDQQSKLIHDMHVRHIFNVLWFILSLIALLYFLHYVVFRDDPLMAFVSVLLFTMHPIHTEVVANVKSRDEIMSLLFICTTFIFAFRYQERRNIGNLIAALVCYLCAFLSKEYAITLTFLLPMAFYIFNGYSVKKSVLAFVPFLGVIALYLALRLQVVTAMSENSDSEVLNNPYYFASATEKLATEIATNLNYIRLLFFPHPLSADYSYNSIPYVDFTNIKVYASAAVYIGMGLLMLFMLPINEAKTPEEARRNHDRGVIAFALAFFLLHFALICNIIFDIGATMGERLIYHSSVGFCIIMGYLLVRGTERIKPEASGKAVLAGILVLIGIPFGYKTITRNADWKNDGTLFAADIKTVPNSVLVVGNVAAADITEADLEPNTAKRDSCLHDAITLLDHALSIHTTFVAGYMNRAIAYYKLGEIEKAKPNLDAVKKLYPTYPTLPGMYKVLGEYYMKEGWAKYGRYQRYPEAIYTFQRALAMDSTNPEIWYNLGGALFSNQQLPEAIVAWRTALKIKPDYTDARNGLQAAEGYLNGQAPAGPPNNNSPGGKHKK